MSSRKHNTITDRSIPSYLIRRLPSIIHMIHCHAVCFAICRDTRKFNYNIPSFCRLHFIAVLILQSNVDCCCPYNLFIFFQCLSDRVFHFAGRYFFRHYLSAFWKDAYFCFDGNSNAACLSSKFLFGHKGRISFFYEVDFDYNITCYFFYSINSSLQGLGGCFYCLTIYFYNTFVTFFRFNFERDRASFFHCLAISFGSINSLTLQSSHFNSAFTFQDIHDHFILIQFF